MKDLTLDVETLNVIIGLLTAELLKYPPGSAEAIALEAFKQYLGSL